MNALKITNHKYLVETEEIKKGIETSFLILAEHLYKICQERIWEGEYDNLREFLLKIEISQSFCSKLCSVYEQWVIKGKKSFESLSTISWTNLYHSIPRLKDEDIDVVYEDAKLLTRQDIIEKGRELKHPDCKHKNTYKLEICEDCGKKWKVYDE